VKAALVAGLLILGPSARGAQPVALTKEEVSDPHELLSPFKGSTDSFKALRAFPETLIYDVSWGFLSVGEATLSVPNVALLNGKPAYHIVSEAVSNKFCDNFFEVRDLNESWMDARTLTSLGYKKRLREGSFFRDEWVLYDTEKLAFLSKKVNRDATYEYGAGAIPPRVQDILSSLYFIRDRKDLSPGAEIVVDVNTKQNWPLVIRVIKKARVKTPAGTFETVLVEPFLRQEGIFIQKGKRLRVWLSDDEKKIPVLMQAEVFFGHITARLSKVL
jgi:hypothetical protein